MNYQVLKFQIGKNGLTEGVIQSLSLAFKTHKQIRVSVLKSSGRTRENIVEIAEKIKSGLSVKIEYKIIGFTIILIKQLDYVRKKWKE